MNIPKCPAVFLLFFLVLVSITSPAAASDMMGWYFPLNLGAIWSYENPDNPADSWSESVFELIDFQGQPAFRFGEDIYDHTIIHRDGGVLSLYAIVVDGITYTLDEVVVLNEVVDGEAFDICHASYCDSSMIRVWDTIDPALQAIYGLDPELTNLVMIASFDPDYPPNLHNAVVASNLPEGVTLPAGAVTGMEWYMRGRGLVDMRDIDAATGGQVEHYVLVHLSPVEETLPSAPVILEQNVPNPFNPSTTFRYQLDQPAAVTLRVYDCSGRMVKELLGGQWQDSGRHSQEWDGLDNRGHSCPSGAYVCRLEAGGVTRSRLITLLR